MFLSLRCALLLSFHLLALQPSFSAAYSWILNAPATQCSNLSITITGSDGTPPYSVLVVPFGPTPLPNGAEVRTVIVQPFDGDSTTTSFAINYPADSQFVAVVSYQVLLIASLSMSGLDSYILAGRSCARGLLVLYFDVQC
jgi:hypothetical protein